MPSGRFVPSVRIPEIYDSPNLVRLADLARQSGYTNAERARTKGQQKAQGWARIGDLVMNALQGVQQDKLQQQAMAQRQQEQAGVTELRNLQAEAARRELNAPPTPEKPMVVGGRLVQPSDGRVIFEPPQEPMKPEPGFELSPGQTRFDATGKQIANVPALEKPPAAPPRPMAVPDGGRLVDPTTGKVLYQAPPKAREGADDVTDLTPEGLDAAALNYAKTGMLPPLGMGDKSTRKQIINRAAAMMPGLDVASAKADFDANRNSLTAIQKQRDALGAFEETALKNLKVFTDIAAKIPDTGSPLLNQPLRYANEKMFGGDMLTAYNTARRTVIPEFAKILANPGLSGQLSDTARKEIEDVVSGNATLKQTMAAARVLVQDTTNRRTSYDDQIAGIKARITKASPGAATGAAGADPLGIRKPK